MSNDQNGGTPKSLRIALRMAILESISQRDPANEAGMLIIKDFLAQRFAVAFLKADDVDAATLDLVSELWNEVTKELP